MIFKSRTRGKDFGITDPETAAKFREALEERFGVEGLGFRV